MSRPKQIADIKGFFRVAMQSGRKKSLIPPSAKTIRSGGSPALYYARCMSRLRATPLLPRHPNRLRSVEFYFQSLFVLIDPIGSLSLHIPVVSGPVNSIYVNILHLRPHESRVVKRNAGAIAHDQRVVTG